METNNKLGWTKLDKYVVIIVGIIIFITIIGCFLIPADFLATISVEVVGTIDEAFWWAGWDENIRVMAALGFYILGLSLIPIILRSKRAHKRYSDSSELEIGIWASISCIFIGVTIFIGITTGISENPYLYWLTIGYVFCIGLYPLFAWKIFHLKLEDIGISRENIGQGLLIGSGLGIGYGFVSSIWHCCRVDTVEDALIFTGTLAMLSLLTFFCVYGGILLGTKVNQYIAFLISSFVYGFLYPWHTLWFVIGYALFGFFLCLLYLRTGTYITVYVAYFSAFLTHTIVPWRGFAVTWYIIIPLGIFFAAFLTFYLIKKEKKGYLSL